MTKTFKTARKTRTLVVRGIVIGAMALLATGCGKKDRPKADLAASQVTTIGVNAYLWRASLDAFSTAGTTIGEDSRVVTVYRIVD